MDMIPQQIGKWFLAIGIALAALGVMLMILGRVGQFRIPGDLVFTGKNWRVYIPLGTCLLASAVLTLLLWIINLFRR
ncbi:MAG: DUF2905 domain-containing protein [Sedimentisphaerales bacterium]|jgi:hypothetical protein|nr:DUF2905 domain-containing protein [Sedimentisphaerales bacterium]